MRLLFIFFILYGWLDVLCVGDSLTSDGGYSDHLSDLSRDEWSIVVSAGRSERSGLTLKRLEHYIVDHGRPSYVVWYSGINDCDVYGMVRGYGDVIGSTCSAIELSVIYGFRLVLVKHHPWSGYRHSKNKSAWMCSCRVNDFIDSMAREYSNIIGVDTWDMGDGEGRLLRRYDGGDGLHLNFVGYAEISRRVYRAIENDYSGVYR